MSNQTPPYKSGALPPVPLNDVDLFDIADAESVKEVWIPDDRPNSVTTRAGEHDGDILDFWVETSDSIVRFEYTSPENSGLAWYRYKPAEKSEEMFTILMEDIESDYTRLDAESGD